MKKAVGVALILAFCLSALLCVRLTAEQACLSGILSSGFLYAHPKAGGLLWAFELLLAGLALLLFVGGVITLFSRKKSRKNL